MNIHGRLCAFAIACLFFVVLNVPAQSTAGLLDQSFGSGGIASIFGVSGDLGNGAVQSDGKILYLMGGSPGYIIRWNADGTPDASFGGAGIVGFEWPAAGGGQGWAKAIALQGPAGDQKVIVAGWTKMYATGKKLVYARRIDRFNPDGTLDATFGSNGSVISATSSAVAVAVQPNGKIITVGGEAPNYYAVRVLPNGGMDSSFGSGGTVNGSSLLNPRAVAIQPDGKIVLAGNSAVKTRDVMSAVRLNGNGTVDTTFGSSGKANVDFGGDISFASDIAFRIDGLSNALTAIALSGSHSQARSVNSNFAVAQLTPAGTLDTSFNGGKTTYDFAGGNDSGYGAAFQSDGKLVVGGYAKLSTNDVSAVRYNADGTLDPNFGTAGRIATDIFGAGDYFNDVVIQNYGSAGERVVMCGVAMSSAGNYTAATRYLIN